MKIDAFKGIYDGSKLNWDANNQIASEEMSTFNYRGHDVLKVVSHRTGKVAEFTISRRQTDVEGDLQWIDFIPTRETLARQPLLSGWSIRLFND